MKHLAKLLIPLFLITNLVPFGALAQEAFELTSENFANFAEKAANQELPDRLYWCSGKRIADYTTLQVGLFKNGPIQVSGKFENGNSIFNTIIPVKTSEGRIDWEKKTLGIWTKHHEDFYAELTIHLTTQVSFDEDGYVKVLTSSNFDWGRRPSIEVAGFKISLGTFARREVEKEIAKFSNELDRRIEQEFN